MSKSSNILAFDIGGTKTSGALCTIKDKTLISTERLSVWPSGDIDSFVTHAKNLANNLDFQAVGIAVAGPVLGSALKQTGSLTNLNWNLSAEALSRVFLNKPVYLFNDMAAHGWGAIHLSSDKLSPLNDVPVRPGNKVLIAAGTGLGEAVIACDQDERLHPLGGEGGHSSFSPYDERDDRLLNFLRPQYGHVSWERVLGGKDGFKNLAKFLCQESNISLPSDLAKETSQDWGELIGALAQRNDPFANQVMSYYALLYGREAANLALKCMPYGGVYLGGGIAPKILPWLKKDFMTGFVNKGRFHAALSKIPVFVVLEKNNGLYGAAIGAKTVFEIS
jgi:glucokinase